METDGSPGEFPSLANWDMGTAAASEKRESSAEIDFSLDLKQVKTTAARPVYPQTTPKLLMLPLRQDSLPEGEVIRSDSLRRVESDACHQSTLGYHRGYDRSEGDTGSPAGHPLEGAPFLRGRAASLSLAHGKRLIRPGTAMHGSDGGSEESRTPRGLGRSRDHNHSGFQLQRLARARADQYGDEISIPKNARASVDVAPKQLAGVRTNRSSVDAALKVIGRMSMSGHRGSIAGASSHSYGGGDTEGIGEEDEATGPTNHLARSELSGDEDEESVFQDEWRDRSWWIFGLDNRFRHMALRIMCNAWFDNTMLAIVLANAISIVCEMELDGKGWAFAVLENIYTTVYTLEFLIKTIALGFVFGDDAYLRDSWNWLDAIVLFSSYLELCMSAFQDDESDLGFIVLLRMIRVLRVLRTLSLFPELRVMVNTLFRAVPSMLRIVAMFVLIMVIFGSLGLQLFSGVLRNKCALEAQLPSNYHGLARPALLGELRLKYEDWEAELDYLDADTSCSQCPGGYVCVPLLNPYHDQQSFDNFGYAFVTLFQAITGEGWSQSMYWISSQTSWWSAIYFIALVLSGTNLVINLLLAVIKESFSLSMSRNIKNKKAEAARAAIAAQDKKLDKVLYESQEDGEVGEKHTIWGVRACYDWLKAEGVDLWTFMRVQVKLMWRKLLSMKTGIVPVIRRYMAAGRNICETRWFISVTMLATLANTIILGIRHRGMSEDVQDVLDLSSKVMLAIFWTETIIKIFSYNITFHHNGFDVFDLIVNTVSVISSVLENEALGGSVTATRNIRIARMIRLVRTMRVLRVLKMVRYLRALRTAVKVLATQAKVVANVALLLLIAMFMYAVLGMFLFKDRYEAALADPSVELLQVRPNFTSFYWSAISMFQVLTLEGWIFLLYDGMMWRPAVAAVFYITYVSIATFVVLSLMQSIILDKFERDFKEHQLMEKRLRDRRREEAMARRAGKPVGQRFEGGAIKVEQIPFMLDALGALPSDANIELVRAHCNILPEDQHVSLDTFVAALPGSQLVGDDTSRDLRAIYSMWLVYDTDNSGELSVQEIQNMIGAIDENLLGQEERLILIDGLCAGIGVGTGQRSKAIYSDLPVPFYIFLKALLLIMQSQAAAGRSTDIASVFGKGRVTWLREQFGTFDKDNSGYIGADELSAFMKHLGQQVDHWELQEILAEMDVDNSGEIGFSEFLRGFSHLIDEDKINALLRGLEEEEKGAIPYEKVRAKAMVERYTPRAEESDSGNSSRGSSFRRNPNPPSATSTPPRAMPKSPLSSMTVEASTPRPPASPPQPPPPAPPSGPGYDSANTSPGSSVPTKAVFGRGTSQSFNFRAPEPMSDLSLGRKEHRISFGSDTPKPGAGSAGGAGPGEEESPLHAFLGRATPSRGLQRWQLAVAVGKSSPIMLERTESNKSSKSATLDRSSSIKSSSSYTVKGPAPSHNSVTESSPGSQGSRSVTPEGSYKRYPLVTEEILGTKGGNRGSAGSTASDMTSPETSWKRREPPADLYGTIFPDGSLKRVRSVEVIETVKEELEGLSTSNFPPEQSLHAPGTSRGSAATEASSPRALAPVGEEGRGSDGAGAQPPSPSTPGAEAKSAAVVEIAVDEEDDEDDDGVVLRGKACGVLPADNRVRTWLYSHLTHPVCEGTLLLLIIVSSIMLATENPAWEETPTWFLILDFVFTGIFTVEVMVKLLVYGVYLHKGAYLRDGWNVLDTVVVVSSLVSIFLDVTGAGSNLSFLRAIRMVRTLRPLRAISRRPQARRAFNTLMAAIPSFLSVSLIVIFIVIVFAIISLDLFAGAFFRCNSGAVFVQPAEPAGVAALNITSGASVRQVCDDTPGHRFVVDGWFCWDTMSAPSTERNETTGHVAWVPLHLEGDVMSEADCIAANFRWVNSIINFDNLGNACFSLFVVITGEGWVEIMQQSIDIGKFKDVPGVSVTNNIELDENSNSSNAMFFVIFITFVTFFLMDMFGGAVYTFYMESKTKEEGLHVLTEAQRKWKDTQQEVRKLVQETTTLQNRATRICEAKWFNITVTILVLIQVLLMFAHYEDEPQSLVAVLDAYNFFMAGALLAELLLKFIAEGQRTFLTSRWNQFDLLILAVSILDSALSVAAYINGAENSAPTGGITTLRLLRLGRFFRSLVQGAKRADGSKLVAVGKVISKLQVVLETFLESFNSLVDIGILLIVFYFIFGVIGMNLFGSIGAPGEYLNGDANFTNIFKAVITLLRISTGEDWQNLFTDIVYYKCDPYVRLDSPDKCSTASVGAFFWLFYMLMVTMIINLFIAIIIENFSTVVSREFSTMGMGHVRSWIEEWHRCGSEFDEEGHCYMSLKSFLPFLDRFHEPLGCSRAHRESREEKERKRRSTGGDGIQSSKALVAPGELYIPTPRVLQRLKELEIGVVDGRVYLSDALEKAVRRVGRMNYPGMGGRGGGGLGKDFLQSSYLSMFANALKENLEEKQEERIRASIDLGSQRPEIAGILEEAGAAAREGAGAAAGAAREGAGVAGPGPRSHSISISQRSSGSSSGAGAHSSFRSHALAVIKDGDDVVDVDDLPVPAPSKRVSSGISEWHEAPCHDGSPRFTSLDSEYDDRRRTSRLSSRLSSGSRRAGEVEMAASHPIALFLDELPASPAREA